MRLEIPHQRKINDNLVASEWVIFVPYTEYRVDNPASDSPTIKCQHRNKTVIFYKINSTSFLEIICSISDSG